MVLGQVTSEIPKNVHGKKTIQLCPVGAWVPALEPHPQVLRNLVTHQRTCARQRCSPGAFKGETERGHGEYGIFKMGITRDLTNLVGLI